MSKNNNTEENVKTNVPEYKELDVCAVCRSWIPLKLCKDFYCTALGEVKPPNGSCKKFMRAEVVKHVRNN